MLLDHHTMQIPGRVRAADSLDPDWFREASMKFVEAEKKGKVVPEGMTLLELAEDEIRKFESKALKAFIRQYRNAHLMKNLQASAKPKS